MKLYRHYKNKPYKFIGFAKHSETLEEMALYETLYDNPEGHIWVRPKKMFFEIVEKDGRQRPRFEAIQLKIVEVTQIEETETALIKLILEKVFGHFDEQGYFATLKNHKSFHLSLAQVEGKIAGFKLGYDHDSELFYSWLGAVLPEFQGLGVASALMKTQHEWCRKQGFKKVQTKTKNKWKEMIILNLRHDFQIIGSYTDKKGEPKLILEKQL